MIWPNTSQGSTGNGVNEIILTDQLIAGLGLTSMLVDPSSGLIKECDVIFDVGTRGANVGSMGGFIRTIPLTTTVSAFPNLVPAPGATSVGGMPDMNGDGFDGYVLALSDVCVPSRQNAVASSELRSGFDHSVLWSVGIPTGAGTGFGAAGGCAVVDDVD